MNTETGEIRFFEDGKIPEGFIPLTKSEAQRLSLTEAKKRVFHLKQMRKRAGLLAKRHLNRKLNQVELKQVHELAFAAL